jgi:GntR family transcriptional regulator, transcriptional repressor for pyruvate dehydrogenase complex
VSRLLRDPWSPVNSQLGLKQLSPRSTSFRALNQRRAFEQIISQVEEAIIDGRLTPGDRLPSERQLAETFGVSRASVREAMRVLEMFGVVTARRGKGPDAGSIVSTGASSGISSVLGLHAALLRIPTADIVALRAVVEGYAVELAAQHAASEHLTRLNALLDEMPKADSVPDFNVLDTELHVELARASGNALLPVLMEALRQVVRQTMVAGHLRLDDWNAARNRLITEHREIITLIEAHDAQKAGAAVRTHILTFYESVAETT